jgi:L-alanine-DL-glutamate epimerase-like enolase superfamily enzyme
VSTILITGAAGQIGRMLRPRLARPGRVLRLFDVEFLDLLVTGGCDIVQPNVCRVGGITPFLRIADLARSFSMPVMPHLLPDISGQLALCLPLDGLVEDIDTGSFAALGAIEPGAVAVDGDALRCQPHIGHGLRFDLG